MLYNNYDDSCLVSIYSGGYSVPKTYFYGGCFTKSIIGKASFNMYTWLPADQDIIINGALYIIRTVTSTSSDYMSYTIN